MEAEWQICNRQGVRRIRPAVTPRQLHLHHMRTRCLSVTYANDRFLDGIGAYSPILDPACAGTTATAGLESSFKRAGRRLLTKVRSQLRPGRFDHFWSAAG
jgi:hypothetical protein